jgi:hypothetical protein
VACAPGYQCTAGVCVPNPSTNCIAITPHDVDFGTVQTGCRSAPVQFTIQNICQTSQTISALGVAGAGFATSSVVLPRSLGVGQSFSITVTFAPTSVGRVNSSLVVGVSAGATVAYQTPVTGNGATTGANQDRFTIPTKTDVVMVVDNSGSMGTHQANLGANANAFLAYAFSANVDFNLGVTTTDLQAANGGFVGPVGSKVLRSTTPNLLQAFNSRVNVGTTGSGFEQMFAPAVASVTPPQITTTNVNFLRGDAALSILAYTDAVEQSSAARNYLEELLRVKGQRRRNEFSFSFVGPTLTSAPTNCLYDGSTTPDPREVDMVRNTGGYFSEICFVSNTQAWRLEAARVGRAVFGARSTWFLTGRPSPAVSSSVAVTINGQRVPENGIATRNWSYDSARNAVVFEPTALPAPGQTVGIDYSVACMP